MQYKNDIEYLITEECYILLALKEVFSHGDTFVIGEKGTYINCDGDVAVDLEYEKGLVLATKAELEDGAIIDNTRKRFIESIDNKFKSRNNCPVEQILLQAKEWKMIKEIIK